MITVTGAISYVDTLNVSSDLIGKFSREEIKKLKWQLVYIVQKKYPYTPKDVLELLCDVILFHQQIDSNGFFIYTSFSPGSERLSKSLY